MYKIAKYVTALAIILMQTESLIAQTWTNPGTGLWTNGANWSTAAPPTIAQTATINNGGTSVLSAAANGVASDVLIRGALLFPSSLVVNTGATLTVGSIINIATSATLPLGQLTVSGNGTLVTTPFIFAGANIGSQGNIELLDGARINVTSTTVLGVSLQGKVIANVSGIGTTWTTNAITIGAGSANGTLTIDSGAQMLVDQFVRIAATQPSGIGLLNLNGTPEARGFLSANNVLGGLGTSQINFDGGILQARADNATFISDIGILNIEAGGAIIDSQEFDIATADSFSGVGQLTKLGTGTLTLTGINENNGATVEEGTLAINGSMTGTILVNNLGTLTGTGVVRGINNFGIVAPGNGIGTLTVTGNHLNTATGTHQNDLNAAGQTDLLAVDETSTLQGGTLDIVAAPGNYLTGTTYTLITAAGGLSGQFANVIDNLPINYLLLYFPDRLVLRLGDAIIVDGLACNARRVAEYINTFGPSLSGDFLNVFTALDTLSFDDLSDALDHLQPASFQALSITSGDAAHAVNDSFMDRLNFLRITRCGQCCDPCDQGGVWISGLANYVSFDRVGCVRGFDATNGGFAIGYDKCFCDDIIAGVGAGYSNNYIKWNRHFGHSDGQNAYLGVYATQFNEDYYADVSLLGFKGTYKSKRHIEFADIDRRAKSKQCNWGINPHFGSGLILDYCGFDVIPFGEIDYYYLSQDKFREHGANSLNLHVKSNDASALRLETGVRFAKAYDCGCGQFLPYASISYVGHRYYGRKFKSSFNDQSNDFSVFGVDRCFNQAEFGLGLAYLINDQFAINASYDIDVGSKRQQQEFNFELNYRF